MLNCFPHNPCSVMLVWKTGICILFWFKTVFGMHWYLFPQYRSTYGDSLSPVDWTEDWHYIVAYDHLPAEMLYHIKAWYPIVKSWGATPSTNVMHLKCSDSRCHNRAAHANGKPSVNNSVALSAACQVVCHVNMDCLEPIIKQGMKSYTKQRLGYLSAVLEGSESTIQRPTWKLLGDLFPLESI